MTTSVNFITETRSSQSEVRSNPVRKRYKSSSCDTENLIMLFTPFPPTHIVKIINELVLGQEKSNNECEKETFPGIRTRDVRIRNNTVEFCHDSDFANVAMKKVKRKCVYIVWNQSDMYSYIF